MVYRLDVAPAAEPVGPITPRPARDFAEKEAIDPTVSGRDYCPESWHDDVELCCTRPVHQKGDHVVGRDGLIVARWPAGKKRGTAK